MAWVTLATQITGAKAPVTWGNGVKSNDDDHETRIVALEGGGGTIKTLINTDSPYTIADGDGFSIYDCDTTSGSIIVNLPTLADNYGRNVTITHNLQGSTNIVTISPEGTDDLTQDDIASIILAKEGDHVEIYGSQQAAAWIFRNERISCQLRLDAYAGYGSTDNKITRFTNSITNIGNCFSENHSTGYSSNNEGLEITVNRSGKYSFSYSFYLTAGAWAGLSLNSSQLTTTVSSITAADRLDSSNAVSADAVVVCWSGFLNAGDIVRTHNDGNGSPGNTLCHFTASYMGN